MSTEIINVLNYIGEKLGIAIDWTAENVLPQVLDILGRYRIFQIVGNSIYMLIIIALAICFTCIGNIMIKNYKSCLNNHSKNLWFYYSDYWNEAKWNIPSCIFMTFLVLYLLFTLIGIPTLIYDTLKWVFVPEVQYLELLKGYIQ